jgi:hypothetical protein
LTATAPPGPGATWGWNWSDAVRSVLSLAMIGEDQVRPKSIDWENLTSNWLPSQSSQTR